MGPSSEKKGLDFRVWKLRFEAPFLGRPCKHYAPHSKPTFTLRRDGQELWSNLPASCFCSFGIWEGRVFHVRDESLLQGLGLQSWQGICDVRLCYFPLWLWDCRDVAKAIRGCLALSYRGRVSHASPKPLE